MSRATGIALAVGVLLIAALVAGALWWNSQGNRPVARPAESRPAAPTSTGEPASAAQPRQPSLATLPKPDDDHQVDPRRQRDLDRAYLSTHARAAQACADADPGAMRGVLKVQLQLRGDGSVESVAVTDRKFKDLDTADCVVTHLGAQRFPAGLDGRRVTHSFRIQ